MSRVSIGKGKSVKYDDFISMLIHIGYNEHAASDAAYSIMKNNTVIVSFNKIYHTIIINRLYTDGFEFSLHDEITKNENIGDHKLYVGL